MIVVRFDGRVVVEGLRVNGVVIDFLNWRMMVVEKIEVVVK